MLGGPAKIEYRTRLRTKIVALSRVTRGELIALRVVTVNRTGKRAHGALVKVKLPRGMKLVAKPRNVHLGKGNTVWWHHKNIGPRKRIWRTLRVVPIRMGKNRVTANSRARNAGRSNRAKVIRVLRPIA